MKYDKIEITIFDELIDNIFTNIEGMNKGSEEIIFTAISGQKYRFWYQGDCCATCSVEDVCGEIQELIDSPILKAEEVSSKMENRSGSQTWTFYIFGTAKGFVTVRWLGESNGYYSESVSFEVCKKKGQHNERR